jgi:hypothetical protein
VRRITALPPVARFREPLIKWKSPKSDDFFIAGLAKLL